MSNDLQSPVEFVYRTRWYSVSDTHRIL